MGMRGRLGWGIGIGRDLKQHMIKTSSFTRSNTAVVAAAAAPAKKKKEEEQSLYLYFLEAYTRGYKFVKRYPIRSVKLSYLLSPSSPTKTNMDEDPNISDQILPVLRETSRARNWAQMSRHHLFTAPSPGAAFLQFHYPSQTCSIRRRRSKAQVADNNFPVIKRMLRHGNELLFLEGELQPANGALYCLSPNVIINTGYTGEKAFQVFDTELKKWLSLQPPPGTRSSHNHNHNHNLSLVLGTKVLVWQPNIAQVYCFDVTQPEKEWLPTPPSVANCIPFINCVLPPLVIEHDKNKFLMFTFDPTADDHSLKVFFIQSHPCVTLQPLKQSLQFPDPPDLPTGFWDHGFPDYRLVHLGGHKICLILHRFFYSLDYDNIPGYRGMSLAQLKKIVSCVGNKGNLILITFEYQANLESLDIEYRVLTTRHLKYTGKQATKGPRIVTRHLSLSGASVL